MTKMYEANNHILILTGYSDPAEHCHMAAHILVSTGGNMVVHSGSLEYSVQGILIPSGVSHRVNTDGAPVLVFLFDSTTREACQISDIQPISEELCRDISDSYFQFAKNGTPDGYRRFYAHSLSRLGICQGPVSVTDGRIHLAMEYIRGNCAEKLTCAEIAKVACLSPSRFSHLFRQQVGMTFAAYVIYQRLLNVYCLVLSGISITEASLEAGFASPSHFADCNRRIFGLSATDITQDLLFQKVI